MVTGRVLIYGGKGALGTKCVSKFKFNNFWVASVDFGENQDADLNILINKEHNLEEQESTVLNFVQEAISDSQLDAVICVAGGWKGGNASKNFAKTADLMWSQSAYPAIISASVASRFLKAGGLISLTGAKAALGPTPEMLGYGMAKAAVHHLTRSLSAKDSGLPDSCTAVAISPNILYTPMNEKWMPRADFSSWTPLEFVADMLIEWTLGKNRPENGSILQLTTNNFITEVVPYVDLIREGDNANQAMDSQC